MAMTGDCGHHCGIRHNAEGTVRIERHCNCAECLCPQAGQHMVRDFMLISWGPVPDPPWPAKRMPMCDWKGIS